MEASDWNETSELKYLTHWMPLPSPPDDVAAPAEQQAAPKAAPASNESAYQRGYMDGMAKGRRDAEAAPQQEAQEPTEIPEEIERMAADRYKVVPSHESMFHRWAVVAGTGTQQLYLGREVECQNMARKFAGAYLDGAFVTMQSTSPNPAPAPLSDDVVRDAAFESVRKKLCALPRFSFLSDGYGVRRVPDKSGSWIAFDAAHELFDPVAVDAVLAAQGGKT